ncbi:MAG: ATP-binding cassette domain-containing protein [Oligoflexia bacterium]|nr:ATP-binding cassette domain-containing protein [Oligoflexia bacterium]
MKLTARLKKSFNGLTGCKRGNRDKRGNGDKGFAIDTSINIGVGIHILFGPSGAGKTTILKLISGLLLPDDGHISIKGKILFSNNQWVPPQLRNIGYMFQNQSLFPHKTVLENIIFGAKNLPAHEKIFRAKDLLHKFELQGLEKRYPKEISGGQQQRVALARTIIRGPDLLLLDEPFSSLDYHMKKTMQKHIHNISEELSIPVILVTHDHMHMSHLVNTVSVINNGYVRIGNTINNFETDSNCVRF